MPDTEQSGRTDVAYGSLLAGGELVQTAYVTNDFDRTIARFAELGVDRFLELREIEFAVGPSAVARCHVGLAVTAGCELEIIEPLGGADDVYRDILSGSDFQLRFHHVAHRLPDIATLTSVRAEAERRGLAIPVEGVAPQGVTYFYADLRPWIGHFVEYVVQTLAFRESMAAIVPVH